MHAFVAKWAKSDGAQLVHYEEIEEFVDELVADGDVIVADVDENHHVHRSCNRKVSFPPRQDPFTGPYDTATAVLEQYSQEFRCA